MRSCKRLGVLCTDGGAVTWHFSRATWRGQPYWLNSNKGIPQAHALRVYTFGKVYAPGVYSVHALWVYTFGNVYAPWVYSAHALNVYTFGKVYAPCVHSAHALRVYYTFGKVYAPCVYSAHALRVYCIPLVKFMYLVFTRRMPGESCRRRFRSL